MSVNKKINSKSDEIGQSGFLEHIFPFAVSFFPVMFIKQNSMKF